MKFQEVYPSVERLIYHACNKYGWLVQGMDAGDLHSEAYIIAMELWEKYDPQQGTKFSSFLYSGLRNRFTDRWRRNNTSRGLKKVDDYDVDISVDPKTLDHTPVTEILSDDAMELVKIAMRSEADLFNLKRTELQNYLYDRSVFSRRRTKRAFNEVTEKICKSSMPLRRR